MPIVRRKPKREQQIAAEAVIGQVSDQDVQDVAMAQSHPMSNDDHIIYVIHDILKSYYKLSRKLFVDNMRKQVAEYCLLIEPSTPLKLFSSKFVVSVSPLWSLRRLKSGTKQQRADLEKDIGLLEKGMAILR